jgi:hypothetical protein
MPGSVFGRRSLAPLTHGYNSAVLVSADLNLGHKRKMNNSISPIMYVALGVLNLFFFNLYLTGFPQNLT